jgi:hypothetical protein
MPSSLRELYATKLAKTPQQVSNVSKALYEEEYLQGTLTGSRIGSGAERNYLLGITPTPQDIIYDTTPPPPPPPPINAKTLSDDLEDLLASSRNLDSLTDSEDIAKTKSAIQLSSVPYKDLFKKLDDGTATTEDFQNLNKWVSEIENPVGLIGGFISKVAFWNKERQERLLTKDKNFENLKKKLLDTINQKGAWIVGKKSAEIQLGDRYEDFLNEYGQLDDYKILADFNANFTPEKMSTDPEYNIEVDGKLLETKNFMPGRGTSGSQIKFVNPGTPLSKDPYLGSIAVAGLEGITKGTELYGVTASNASDIMLGIMDPGTFYKQIKEVSGGTSFNDDVKSALNTQKQIVSDALNKKALYFSKVYEKAVKDNDVELQKQSVNAIKSIQKWFNVNNEKPKIEDGFINTIIRSGKTFGKAAAEATRSTVGFVFPSVRPNATERFIRAGETAIAVPVDINSDGKINQLDKDYYGNLIYSNQFHYRGEKGEWKTNWSGLPEASSQVIGQMVPTIAIAALTEGATLALLPEVGVAAEGVVAARNLNLAQKALVQAQKVNQFKVLGQELRLLDRVGTFASVTASTYDMMLDQELRYTKDINVAKNRALGRAMIEGATEMIGVPVFGLFRGSKFGIGIGEASKRVANATLPGSLTKTERIKLILDGMTGVGKKVAGQSIAESMEEIVADLGNYMMTDLIKRNEDFKKTKDPYLKVDELTADSLINTFTESFFTMLPFTGITNAVSAVNEYNTGNRQSLSEWTIANNPDQAISYIKSELQKGSINQKEAERRVNEVNRLVGVLNSMENLDKIKDLRTLLDDPDAQRRYFSAMVHRQNLAEIDYENLTPEQKTLLNKLNLKDVLNEKSKKKLEELKSKQVPLTNEESSLLTDLKQKTKRTAAEEKQFKDLSERGTLSVEEAIELVKLSSFVNRKEFDKTKLTKEDYQDFVKAGLITQEDLTPKSEDLQKQIEKADANLYRYQEQATKYENLTREEKDKIIIDLFQEKYDQTSKVKSPTELAELVRATKTQLDMLGKFNDLNELDYNLRKKLEEVAKQRFEELVTVNENGRTALAEELVNEDLTDLTVSQAYDKYLFVAQESKEGYIDNKTQQELEQKYLGAVYSNIDKFNKSSREAQVEMLVKHFDSMGENDVDPKILESRLSIDALRQQWTIQEGENTYEAVIAEDVFEEAQAAYYEKRGLNRAAGNNGQPVVSTEVSQEAPAGVSATEEEDYEQDESAATPEQVELEKSPEPTRFEKSAQKILTTMKEKGYSNHVRTLGATFSNIVNDKIKRNKSNRATKEVHQAVIRILQDALSGKKNGIQASAELKRLLDKEMPDTDPKNTDYRHTANFFVFVAEALHNSLGDQVSLEEEQEALKASLGEDFVKVEGIETEEEVVHDSPDLLNKEAVLQQQLAQVKSWVNPLRTAAFETNEAEVSQDPARTRNAEILNSVQENPNPERRIQVSSREYFYRQILKDNYDAFVTRLQQAIKEKDTSPATLNELQSFFGGNFFAVLPTATGEAELIYLIKSEGKGLLSNPSPVVTFVVNGELEMFESQGKMYPFYANLTLAKHLEESAKEIQGTQAREVPSIIQDFQKANPEEYQKMVSEGLATLAELRAQVTNNPQTRVVFDMEKITMGNRIGTKIIQLSEVDTPLEITYKSKETETNGMSYPGLIGSGVALIEDKPYLLFNRFVEEVGGRAEIEALAELIFDPEVRSKFFLENKELVDYFANHYNIFSAGGRKLEFSTKKGDLSVFAVEIDKNNKKKFIPILTREEFINFMTKTGTPGIRYNVKREALGSNTSMFTMKDGEVVEVPMTYTQFVKATHKILYSKDSTLRNKQIVFNETSLNSALSGLPKITTPPPVSPVIVPAKTTPETKEEVKKLSKVPSAPLISPKSVQDVEKALTALDEKRLVPNPENEDVYIEVDDKGNRIPGTPEWTRASTIAGKFDGGKKHANRGTIVDSMLREFVSGNVESVEDLIRIYENHPLKNETNAFSRKFMEDLFDTFSEVKESTDAAGIKLLATTRTLWGEINGKLYAGTIDLLGIDKEGKVYIIDLKTSTGNRRNTAGRYYESNRKKDSIQQSAYGELLRQRTGITVSNLVIFPVQTPLTTIDGVETYDSAIPNKSEDNKFTLPIVIDTDIFPKTPAVNVAPKAPVSTDAKAEIERRRQEKLSTIVSEVSTEENRRPNGSIGTQGFDPTQMKNLIKFLNDKLNLNIDNKLFEDEKLKPLIDFIKNNKVLVEKIKQYIRTNPIEISKMPDGSLSFRDGNHRANLLNLIGSDVLPTIEVGQRNKVDEINAKYDAELAALEAKPETKEEPVVSKELSFPKTTDYMVIANAMESVSKLLWEQLPKEYKGKVVVNEDGTSSYYVKGYKSNPNLEVKLTFTYEGTDNMPTDLHKIMLSNYYPDLIAKNEVIKGPFPLELNKINFNNFSITGTFTEDGVEKGANLPTTLLGFVQPNDFAKTFLEIISGNSVSSISDIVENKKAIGEGLMEKLEASSKSVETKEPANPFVPNVFNESEKTEGEEKKNNCETTTSKTPTKPGKPNKPANPISSNKSKK